MALCTLSYRSESLGITKTMSVVLPEGMQEAIRFHWRLLGSTARASN